MKLSEILERVQATEGLSDVLNETQQKRVKYAGLQLTAAVTQYLAKAILYFEDDTLSMLPRTPFHVLMARAGKLIGKLIPTKEFDERRKQIEAAARQYTDSMGFLAASITGRALRHLDKQNRCDLLKWIWEGDYWKRHRYLRQKRVPGTGTWFLNSSWYKDWRDGVSPNILICLGMRMFIQLLRR